MHHAARIGGEAQGNEILVSQETIDAANDARKSENPRTVLLKGIARATSVVSLNW